MSMYTTLFVPPSYEIRTSQVRGHNPTVAVNIDASGDMLSLHFDNAGEVYTFIDRLAKAAATLDADIDEAPTVQEVAQDLARAESIVGRPVVSPLLS